MKKSLADIIAGDEELVISTAVETQLRSFLVQPLSGLLIARPIIFVIDAVDEILDGTHARAHALDTLLKSIKQQMYNLAPNIRFLITARPEIPILRIFEECPGVRVRDMAHIPSTEADILLYTQARLLNDPIHSSSDIDLACCQTITHMSQTLFQWAFVACNEITNGGLSPRTMYDQLASTAAGVGQNGLLDQLYMAVLSSHFSTDQPAVIANFTDAMSFVLALREPLPETGIRTLWKSLGRSVGDLDAVLNGARSLLIGVGDVSRNLQPSHTSFLDFLIDPTRSGRFTITITDAHTPLAIATLTIMRDQLKFNICDLPSSYRLSKEVEDLNDRIHDNISSECSYACRSWADHLGAVQDLVAHPDDLQLRLGIEMFLTKKLLSWLEVQSVLGRISLASAAISTLVSFLSVCLSYCNSLQAANTAMKHPEGTYKA